MFIWKSIPQTPRKAIHNIMRFLGIDYSMTCPAITVMDEAGNSKSYFLTGVRKHEGAGTRTGTHGRTHAWEGIAYPSHNCQEQRFDNIANWAVEIAKGADAILIEDYAMGAKGKVFHIAENCGLLKHKLWVAGLPFDTIAPTALKKFATGKGNSDKCKMHDAFVDETGIDLMKAMDKESKDCGSPVSDIVDSYYLARYALTKRQRP
jgi:Holliday junction resolvasome RuvABC endonuclease subunit